MADDYDRWCQMCQCWVPEGQTRVRADGKPRHKACDTITLATQPTDMQDLAARMAADEANEGNYAAAAELQAAAEGEYPEIGGAGVPFEQQTYERHGLTYRGDPDAPTGPLTPGQVPCRVCGLDDRTRAATDPDDLQCAVCRADEPNRVRRERWSALRTAAATFLGLEELADDETAAGSMERDLVNEQVGALMALAELVDGHSLPYSLVNAAELGTEKAPAEDTRYVVAAVKNQRVLQLWDGDLFDRPDDHVAQSDLQDARERAHFDASPWNVCALIPVPDETVFGDKQPEDPR
jgi:hypothetical protein